MLVLGVKTLRTHVGSGKESHSGKELLCSCVEPISTGVLPVACRCSWHLAKEGAKGSVASSSFHCSLFSGQQLGWIHWCLNRLIWGFGYLISDTPCLNFHIKLWTIHTLYLMNSVCAGEIPCNWFGIKAPLIWVVFELTDSDLMGSSTSLPLCHFPATTLWCLEGCTGTVVFREHKQKPVFFLVNEDCIWSPEDDADTASLIPQIVFRGREAL